MTLKTLDDLKAIGNGAKLLKLEIKAEAVKRVKKEQKEYPDSWYDYCEVLMDFCNITEEDLKEVGE